MTLNKSIAIGDNVLVSGLIGDENVIKYNNRVGKIEKIEAVASHEGTVIVGLVNLDGEIVEVDFHYLFKFTEEVGVERSLIDYCFCPISYYFDSFRVHKHTIGVDSNGISYCVCLTGENHVEYINLTTLN